MAGLVMPPLAAFLLEAAKEAFRNRIIPTISQTTHDANKTLCFQHITVCLAGIPRSECTISPSGGRRSQIAILNASQTSVAVIRELILQPTTFLENKSMTTARYSQPS
jgi:hypothetical protein